MKIRLHLLSILFFLLFGLLTVKAQTEIDSLTSLLKTTTDATVKLSLYKEIGWYYIDRKPDMEMAWKYADSVKLLSENLKNEKGKMTAVYYYGVIAEMKGDFETASKNLENYITYTQSLGDSAEITKGLFHLGIVNMFQGNYDEATTLFYKNLAIEEKLKNKKKIAHVLNAIGTVYQRTNKFKEAINKDKQAGAIYKSLGLKIDYGRTLQNMANSYLSLHKYDSAKIFYMETLQLFQAYGNQAYIAIVLGNIGNLYEATNKYNEALGYHQRALAIWRQLNQKKSLANCLNNLGNTFLELKKYNNAERHLHEALQTAKSIGANALLQEVYMNMNELSVQQKDFKSAYHFYTLSNQLKDSIFNEKNTKNINELQAKYESEKKDKQIILLANEKEAQLKEAQQQAIVKKALIGGLLLITIIALLIIFMLRLRMKNQKVLTLKNQEIQASNLKREISELEMKALRTQINPHFIFNSMNSINRMILDADTEGACRYLGQFSKLVRLILENSENTKVSLHNELAMLESYIQLEDMRFKGRIGYKINVSETIDQENTYLPAMMLQPFVENAIWHGLMHKPSHEKGFINIGIHEAEDMLICMIEDNGVGREQAANVQEKSMQKTKSMGLQITERRLKLLNKNKVTEMINIVDLKGSDHSALGTRVNISIPLN
jgi:tetratricopeptide (TPR) repeat protein/anti-sigma regulatory factor (Ser/Thr protein kinase)